MESANDQLTCKVTFVEIGYDKPSDRFSSLDKHIRSLQEKCRCVELYVNDENEKLINSMELLERLAIEDIQTLDKLEFSKFQREDHVAVIERDIKV